MDGLKIQGLWLDRAKSYHINLLELRAVHLALKSFLPAISSSSRLLQMDNTTTMHYLNKQRGTCVRPLSIEAQTIWRWLTATNLTITAVHLPGVQNVEADALSREFQDNHDWVLHDEIGDSIFQEWGLPQIDLFTDCDNRKGPGYASRFYQPGSKDNALLLDWSRKFLYAFPPIPLIPAVFIKLYQFQAQARMIFIAPEWPRQW